MLKKKSPPVPVEDKGKAKADLFVLGNRNSKMTMQSSLKLKGMPIMNLPYFDPETLKKSTDRTISDGDLFVIPILLMSLTDHIYSIGIEAIGLVLCAATPDPSLWDPALAEFYPDDPPIP